MKFSELLNEETLPNMTRIKSGDDYSGISFDMIINNLKGQIKNYISLQKDPNAVGNKSVLTGSIKSDTHSIELIKVYQNIFKLMPTSKNIADIYENPDDSSKWSSGTKKAIKSNTVTNKTIKLLDKTFKCGGICTDAMGRADGGVYAASGNANVIIDGLLSSIKEYKSHPKSRLEKFGVNSFEDYYFAMAKLRLKKIEIEKKGQVFSPLK